MKETDPAAAKLKRIEQLWLELQREIPDGPEYEALAERILALSIEYLALVKLSKPENANRKSNKRTHRSKRFSRCDLSSPPSGRLSPLA
jgi:hypothetical protein